MSTIAVAMSGGVDSSVAAAILKQQGHGLVGFTMQLWNQRRRLALGEMSKAEVREMARSLGLETAEKAESQEICFVPDGHYAAFVEKYAKYEMKQSEDEGALAA